MNTRWQTILFILLILVSVAVTQIDTAGQKITIENENNNILPPVSKVASSQNLTFQRASLVDYEPQIARRPLRKWDQLDPQVSSKAVFIQSIDDNVPFLHIGTYTKWPVASLTKLLTAVVVLEEIGIDKKITVTQNAINTEGGAGGLIADEVYTAYDLLKIMLLSSSNDAAVAFEDYLEQGSFVGLMQAKAQEIGMMQSSFVDSTGLSPQNTSTASDLFRLIRYILEKHPDIFTITRSPSFLVQPINEPRSQTIQNIHPFVQNSNFLGGKTGTSQLAKENLISIFSDHNYRIVIVLLGSTNRVQETKSLVEWLAKAYEF